MPIPILTTKLVPPPRREGIINRPRLYRQLDEGLTRRLTLLSAPAGFGKTTLLSDWLNRPRAEGESVRVGWVTLDESDNEAGRFWSYVLAALRRLYPNLAEPSVDILRAPHTTPNESLLVPLLNDLAQIPDTTLLILDDFHVIDNEDIHSTVAFWLEHQPPQFHLFLSTRLDPPLPLARLRARNELVEIRAADLRFNQDEVHRLFQQVNVSLPSDDIAALERRTEGWPVGLHLAILSLKGRPNPEEFLRQFTGSHRYILDYLSEEVLLPQTGDVQTFLMQTSILEELTAPLCRAVSGRSDSHRLLEELARANLFLIPVDEQGQWYRYHRLFSDLLQRRLAQTATPEEITRLHRQAAQWYEQSGMLDRAISHRLKAGDYEEVARLVVQNLPRLFHRYRFSVLLKWMEQLPPSQLDRHPPLGLLYAWLLFVTGRADEAELRLASTEDFLAKFKPGQAGEQAIPLSPEDFRTIQGAALALRAQLELIKGNLAGTVSLSQEALAKLSTQPEESLLAGITRQNLGLAYWLMGDEEAASRVLSEPAETNGAHRHIAILLSASNLAELYMLRGQLSQAARWYRRILSQLEQVDSAVYPMIAGTTYAELGHLEYEWNHLDTAESHFRAALALSREGIGLKALARAYIGLMKVQLAHGEFDSVRQLLGQLEDRVQEVSMGLPRMLVPLWRVQYWLARGDMGPVSAWIEETLPAFDDPHPMANIHLPFLKVTLARALLAVGQVDSANRILAQLRADPRCVRQTDLCLYLFILQALVYQVRGDIPAALEQLELALSTGEKEGYIRIFVDEGPAVAGLLLRLVDQLRQRDPAPVSPSPAYLQRLLDAFGVQADLPPAPVPAPDGLFVEPLTEREREILQLLAAGLSNEEIAERLVIARSTLKTHLKNIYGKLDAHSRLEAVARAKELSLL